MFITSIKDIFQMDVIPRVMDLVDNVKKIQVDKIFSRLESFQPNYTHSTKVNMLNLALKINFHFNCF